MEALSQPIVPIEQSPLSGRSVIELLGTTGVASYLAVATGQPLVALAVTPVVILVFSAASGAASALHDGIRYRILRKMGVPLRGKIDIGAEPADLSLDQIVTPRRTN